MLSSLGIKLTKSQKKKIVKKTTAAAKDAGKSVHRSYKKAKGIDVKKVDTDMEIVDQMKGPEFEEFVASVLKAIGYEKVKVSGTAGDQGVDVLARKDGETYAIQCKRYGNKLDNTPVQEIYAGAQHYNSDKAAVMTNNYFTDGAKQLARSTGVILWDRDELMKMMEQAQLAQKEKEKNE